MQAGSFPAPGASLHLDFVNNQGFSAGQTGTATSFLTFTNASTQNYIDASGNLVSASANSPVREFSRSSIGTILGLRVQKQRTNSIRNNTMAGAVAGTPGTVPTNWFITGSGSGLTRTLSTPGQVNGIECLGVRFAGTASTTSSFILPDGSTSVIAVTPGETWSASVFCALSAGSTANINALALRLSWFDSSQVTTGTPASANITLTGSLAQTVVTGVAPANAAFVRPEIRVGFSNGAVLDYTILVGLPQCEKGSGATSPIKTSGSAVTRAGDVVALTDFASIFNQWGGTVVSEWVYGTDTSTAGVWIVSDGTASNAIRGALYNGAGANVSDVLVSGSSPGGASVATQNTAATTYRHAVEYDRTILAASGSGAAQDQVLTPSMPASLSAMYLGCGSGNGAVTNNLDGWLRQLIYFPRAARPYQLPGLSR